MGEANNEGPVLLSQDALAERWDLSPRTLERWRWRGVGPAWVRIGRHVRYRLADIESYEANRRRDPGADPTLPVKG